MRMERGILVDAKGAFLGAFQWDASKPRPQFNLPRTGNSRVRAEDQKTLLPERAAVPGMEDMRWDFGTESWNVSDKQGWLVDDRGNMRGSRRFFADTPPALPVGWELTEIAPPRRKDRRAYFDQGAWKFSLRKARIENDTLMNFECIRDDLIPVPGVEYIERPLLADGTAADIGATRMAGIWTPAVNRGL